VSESKKFINYYFFILLHLKRFIYLLKKITIFIYFGINWFFKSKEHTSFSFHLSNELSSSIAYRISKLIDVELNEVKKLFKFLKSVNVDKPKFSSFLHKTSDIDFVNKFDYRVIPFSLFYLTEVKHVIELGFNQGRLLFLLNKFHSEFRKFLQHDKKYIGLDFNPRKGGFLKNVNLILPSEIHFDKVENYFIKNKEMISSIINDSILICTTHEKNSEDFIFNFLEKNNYFPKFIISDNILENSSFYKYYKNNTDKYEYELFTFYNKNIFYNNLEIGVLKYLT